MGAERQASAHDYAHRSHADKAGESRSAGRGTGSGRRKSQEAACDGGVPRPDAGGAQRRDLLLGVQGGRRLRAAFLRLNALNNTLLRVGSMDAVEDNEYLVSMRNFANRNPGGFMRTVHEDVIADVWRTRTALVDFWKENVWNEMRYDILLFKGFSVLDRFSSRQCRMLKSSSA
jgi:hypothetical protein